MAFNIDIPGPKLINTNFSQSLGELGQIFGQIRENAVIRDTLAGMQSDDPVSVDQTISKLLMTGRTGRDLALKMQEQQDRIKQRALQERGLGVQERGVAVREGELGRGLDADKAAAERQRKFEEFMSKGDTALPPADTEDGPTIRSTTGIRPSSESQPTTFTPGGRAVQERFPTATGTEDWDLRAKRSTPGPQSELIGGSSDQAELIGGADTLEKPVGPTGPTSPAPASEELRLRPASLRERALEKEVQRLTTGAQFADGDQLKAIQTRINFLNEERKDLRNRREKALERQQQEALDEKKRRAAIEDEPIKEMLKTGVGQAAGGQYARGILNRMAEVTRDPNVVSGEYGRIKAEEFDSATQTAQSLKNMGFGRIIPQSIKDLAKSQMEAQTAPGRQFKEMQSLEQQLVQARIGDKGFMDRGLSNQDREALERSSPSAMDSPAVRQSKIALQMAWEERKEDIRDIRRRGIKQGLTTAQIEENVQKFANKYSIIEDAKKNIVEVRTGKKEAQAPAEPQRQAPAAPPKEGETKEYGGKRWQFIGGDPANPRSWREMI